MSDYIEHERGGPDVRDQADGGWAGKAELPSGTTGNPQNGKQLATLAAAALAPTIIKSAFKFVTRHPLLTAAGLAGYTVAMMQSQHRTRNLTA